MRVLVVDDDEFARDMLQHTLRKSGYDVVTAENGREALEIISRFRPNIAILDVDMPEMDGFAVARQVKEDNLPT